MILGADCLVTISGEPWRQVFDLNANLGGDPTRAVLVRGAAVMLRLADDGRIVGVHVRGEVPVGAIFYVGAPT